MFFLFLSGNAVYQRGIPLEHWKLTSAASNRERGLTSAAPKTTPFFAASTTGKNPSKWVRKAKHRRKCSFSSPKLEFYDGIIFPSSVMVFSRSIWDLEWLLTTRACEGCMVCSHERSQIDQEKTITLRG